MKILITGGTSRLGEALVRRFCSQGHDVVFTYNRAADAAIRLAGTTGASATHLDLAHADTASINALMTYAEKISQSFDLLVNNSSQFVYDEPGALNPALLAESFQINCTAALMLTEAFMQQQSTSDCRVVVNVLDAKMDSLNPDYLSYTLSKMALMHATQLYGMRTAETPVRVYGVAPAMFAESGPKTAGRVDELVRMNPLKHALCTDDLVHAIEFCARGHLQSGEIIRMDAGQSLMTLARDVAYL